MTDFKMKDFMKKFLKPKLFLFFFLFLIMLGSVGTAVFFYMNYQKLKKNPELISQQEVKSVSQAIGQFMELPTDEEPTLATVTDQEKLKDQDFFKKAQNGDKVLIYTKAQKAILYRPSTNKIIEFAPLTLGGQEQVQGETTQNATPVNIAILNGSDNVGLASEIEKNLASISNLVVKEKRNAAKNDYTQTQVIDVSKNNAALAEQIAQTLGGSVAASLPEGETANGVDILIIAAK